MSLCQSCILFLGIIEMFLLFYFGTLKGQMT